MAESNKNKNEYINRQKRVCKSICTHTNAGTVNLLYFTLVDFSRCSPPELITIQTQVQNSGFKVHALPRGGEFSLNNAFTRSAGLIDSLLPTLFNMKQSHIQQEENCHYEDENT